MSQQQSVGWKSTALDIVLIENGSTRTEVPATPISWPEENRRVLWSGVHFQHLAERTR